MVTAAVAVSRSWQRCDRPRTAEQDAWLALDAREILCRKPFGGAALYGLKRQPARISRNIDGSMLPPDSITTVRPGGVTPIRYAASATAPLGSATRCA